MDLITKRRIRLAKAAGAAESAGEAAAELRVEALVSLEGEDFAKALAEELTEITERIKGIGDDLIYLAYAGDIEGGFGNERYRLSHCGAEPEPDSKTVKARDLKEGFSVKAPGAPAWSPIRKVERDEQHPAVVTVFLDWGSVAYHPDEDVEIEAVQLRSAADADQLAAIEGRA